MRQPNLSMRRSKSTAEELRSAIRRPMSRRLFDANDPNSTARGHWTTNHAAAQQRSGNIRNCPDLRVANPSVAGSSPARPTTARCTSADALDTWLRLDARRDAAQGDDRQCVSIPRRTTTPNRAGRGCVRSSPFALRFSLKSSGRLVADADADAAQRPLIRFAGILRAVTWSRGCL
jgi:hypothetical protein